LDCAGTITKARQSAFSFTVLMWAARLRSVYSNKPLWVGRLLTGWLSAAYK